MAAAAWDRYPARSDARPVGSLRCQRHRQAPDGWRRSAPARAADTRLFCHSPSRQTAIPSTISTAEWVINPAAAMSRPTRFTKPQSFFMVPPFPPARAGSFVLMCGSSLPAPDGALAISWAAAARPRFPPNRQNARGPCSAIAVMRRGSALRTRSGQRRRWFLHCSRPPGARANGKQVEIRYNYVQQQTAAGKSISKIWSSSGSTACMYFRYIFFVSLLFRSDGRKPPYRLTVRRLGKNRY